jgi:hypothetical protein
MEIPSSFIYSSPYFAIFTKSMEFGSLMKTNIGVLVSYGDNIRYKSMEEHI